MPWRSPEYEGEFPSLGWEILDWAYEYLRVPDGPLAGEPLELTDEQAALLVRFYQLDDRGRFVYRRAAVRRAKGWGKSPLLALIALAELCGPSRFDGWDAQGEPVAVRPKTPLVQIAAVSEDQAGNTYNAILGMARESELAGTVLDIGITRIYLIGEMGVLEPVTASAGSRQGQRVTFAVLDETHLWTKSNGGLKLNTTIRQNASKMDGRTFESTNAFAIGENSVAERTHKAAEQGAAGLLYDAVEAPHVDDLTDGPAVRAALEIAYGDSVKWVNLDRLVAECADPGTDPESARRFYFNQPRAGGDCPFDIKRWETLADPGRVVGDGERVALGFDGSIYDDSTALYGCTADGFIFEIAVWERPRDAFGQEWHVPRAEVHDAVREAFGRFDVGLMLVDPAQWRDALEQWHELYKLGDKPAEARVLPLETNQPGRFSGPCDRLAVAIREGTVSHDGLSGLTENLAACARKQVRVNDDEDDGRTRWVIVKSDRRKIDRAVAAVLAVEAAAQMPPKNPKNALRWLQQLVEQRNQGAK